MLLDTKRPQSGRAVSFLWSTVITYSIYSSSFCLVCMLYCVVSANVLLHKTCEHFHTLRITNTLTKRKIMTRGRNISRGVLDEVRSSESQGITCYHSQQCVPSASECEQAS